jgi:hypothetical protein
VRCLAPDLARAFDLKSAFALEASQKYMTRALEQRATYESATSRP